MDVIRKRYFRVVKSLELFNRRLEIDGDRCHPAKTYHLTLVQSHKDSPREKYSKAIVSRHSLPVVPVNKPFAVLLGDTALCAAMRDSIESLKPYTTTLFPIPYYLFPSAKRYICQCLTYPLL